MNKLISIAIITSPSPHHPDTSMIWQVIDSLKYLRGLDACPVQVVCDGFSTRPAENIRGTNLWSMSKVGIIIPEAAASYDTYCSRLEAEFEEARKTDCARSLSVLRLPSHHGFAFAVQTALMRASTPYVLVLQHDRAFSKQFDCMSALIQACEAEPTIRYVGFPTVTSAKHDDHQHSQYRVRDTLLPLCRVLRQPSGSDFVNDFDHQLVPLIFWYDSNHLAHVKRYLEIYRPFTYAPAELRSLIGSRGLKDMLLRRGDFIEDRLGQVPPPLPDDHLLRDGVHRNLGPRAAQMRDLTGWGGRPSGAPWRESPRR